MKITIRLLCLSVLSACTFHHTADAAPSDWPSWRGPLANGTSPDSQPPSEWSDTKNVKWKVKLLGKGSATPAVWGEKVFILTAVEIPKPAEKPAALAAVSNVKTNSGGANTNAPAGGRRRRGGPGGRGSDKPTNKVQFTVMCLDRKTGKTLWQKIAREEIPHEGHHQDHGYASASPITDGKVVLAYFGSRGLRENGVRRHCTCYFFPRTKRRNLNPARFCRATACNFIGTIKATKISTHSSPK